MKPFLLSLLTCYSVVIALEDFTLLLSNESEVEEGSKPNRELKRVEVIGSDPSPSRLPLGRCQGDCDSDEDCDEGLVCFQKGRFTVVPGCSGGLTDGSYSDYCVRHSDIAPTVKEPNRVSTGNAVATTASRNRDNGVFPHIQIVGNNVFDHLGPSVYPLNLCEGDCDSSSDCRGSLVCFQRGRNQPVFGCRGGPQDSSHQDYCINKDSILVPNERPALPYTSSNFRLKLYWEEGYRWQDESRERKWCMMYNYRSRNCWHGLRRKQCDQDAIYISKCKENEARQLFAFEYLAGGDEVRIRLGSGHTNSCFERRGRSIVLRRCNAGSSLQKWYAPNGDFHGYRFEISQKNYNNQCVTQAHHPKEGEVVELHSCSRSRDRDHQSSYWNVY